MDYEVWNQKETDGTYTLVVDGETFKTPLDRTRDIDALTETVDSFIYCNTLGMENTESTFIVKLSGEEKPLGIIIDIYENGTEEEPTETTTLLFDDFLDTEEFIDPAGGHGLSSHV
jgi:hypothetical protein